MSETSQSFQSFSIKTKSGSLSKTRGVDVSEHTLKTDDGDEIKVADSVMNYVVLLDKEKETKKEKEEHSKIIRDHTSSIRNFFIKHGTYLKTYRLVGEEIDGKQYAVDVMENDKFTAPKNKEDIQLLRDSLGENMFKKVFEEVTTISIKSSVMEDENQRKELSKILYIALGADGIKKFFDRGTEWVVKKGLPEKIHTYEKDIQEIIKKDIVQTADTIKDASSNV